MWAKYKNIIIVVLVIIIGFVIYAIFIKADPEADSGIGEKSTRTDRVAILGKDIDRAISQIQALSLDKSIFEDPVLQSLVDKNKRIEPQPIGRQNPFEPLEGRASDKPETVQVEAVRN